MDSGKRLVIKLRLKNGDDSVGFGAAEKVALSYAAKLKTEPSIKKAGAVAIAIYSGTHLLNVEPI